MISSEKIEALFTELAGLTHELKKATAAAETLQILNADQENVTKVVADFKAVQTNTAALEAAAGKAVKNARRLTKWGVVGALLGALVIGAGAGVLLGYQTSERIYFADARVTKLKAAERQFASDNQAVVQLKRKGFRFYENAIILPEGKTVEITQTGENAIFTD